MMLLRVTDEQDQNTLSRRMLMDVDFEVDGVEE
jgi:hypothetical protein